MVIGYLSKDRMEFAGLPGTLQPKPAPGHKGRAYKLTPCDSIAGT